MRKPVTVEAEDVQETSSEKSEEFKIYTESQLNAFNKTQLQAICEERNIEYAENATRAILISLILEQQEEAGI